MADNLTEKAVIPKHHFEAMKEVLSQLLGIFDFMEDHDGIEKRQITNFDKIKKLANSLSGIYLPPDHEEALKEALEGLSNDE